MRGTSSLWLLALLLVSAPAPAGPQKAAGSYTAAELEAHVPRWPNPYLSFLPAEAEPDWAWWRARMQLQARRRRATPAPSALAVTESEAQGEFGLNDLPPIAEPIAGFGTGAGENPAADLTGHLLPLPNPVGPSAEPDDAFPQAHPIAVPEGEAVTTTGTIGDGVHGSSGSQPSGDFDFFRFAAGAEETIEVSLRTPVPLGDLNPIVALYDAAGTLVELNDDVPLPGLVRTYDSYLSFTTTAAGDYFVAVGGFLPVDEEIDMLPADPWVGGSGPGAGSEGIYDLIVGRDLPPPRDGDCFRFPLRAGDVVGANLLGGARRVALYDPAGELLVAAHGDLSGIYPAASPLPGGGDAALAYVVDTAGTYTVGVDAAAGLSRAGDGSYTVELRVFRPPLDLEAEEEVQILFLDFDGATLDASIFYDPLGHVTLSPFAAFLRRWGLTAADEDAVVDAVLGVFDENLSQDLRARGKNGDFQASGRVGEFDVEIRNSRDHPDPFGQARVSRVIIGGTTAELGLTTIAIAQSIDVGNFATAQTAVVLLDLLSAPEPDPNSLNSLPRAPGATMIDLIGTAVGTIAAHEAGHFVANFHTARDPVDGFVLPTVMDSGGDLANTLGLGDDAVFGTGDDLDVDFGPDLYEPREAFTGVENTLDAISFGLPAGGRRPRLGVTPPEHDFGALDLGASADQTFVVGNDGNLPLAVTATELIDGTFGAYAITAGGGPFALDPLATRPLTVSFTPSALGATSATLRIASDDPDAPAADVELAGQGGIGEVAVDPMAHDFGDLFYGDAGTSISHPFAVRNAGAGGDLRIGALVLSGGEAGQFALTGGEAPFVLAPGQERQVTVHFAPGGRVGAMTTKLVAGSNDPRNRVLAVPLSGVAWGPDVTISPSSPYHFGAIVVGTERSRRFKVGNVGQLDLEVTAVTLDGEDVDVFAITSGGEPFTVLSGAVHEVVVSATPEEVAEKTAVLRIASNDPDEDLLEIELLAAGVVPEIVVDPSALGYGQAEVGSSITRPVRITNAGGATLRGATELTGPQAADYVIVGGGGSFGLAAGGTLVVRVTFRPSSPGAKTASLRITSNDPARPTAAVRLTGRGVVQVLAIPAQSQPGLVALALLLAGWGLVRLRPVSRRRPRRRPG